MFGRLTNVSLHILAFRLKYFPAEGDFNDCDIIKRKSKRTNRGYMGIVDISYLFRTFRFCINKGRFLYGVFTSLN